MFRAAQPRGSTGHRPSKTVFCPGSPVIRRPVKFYWKSSLIGNKETICFELGERAIEGSPDLFKFDVWLIGHHITYVDNVAYLKCVVSVIECDLADEVKLKRYADYFIGMSPEEAHRFIVSTRDTNSEKYDIEGDEIYPNQNILNWGPNSDNVTCFVIPINGRFVVTLEHHSPLAITGKIFSKEMSLQEFNRTIEAFVEYGRSKI